MVLFSILNLHSTMYLLNQVRVFEDLTFDEFTFHYVSIKSKFEYTPEFKIWNLHSTMYLLNLQPGETRAFTMTIFTFHYVSIKSASDSLTGISTI